MTKMMPAIRDRFDAEPMIAISFPVLSIRGGTA
jgi:hypothetical protein